MGHAADILIPDINGLTPLMYAVFYENYELIWQIIKYNKHAVFSIDNDGSSTFSYAVAHRNKKICQKLLTVGDVMNQTKAKSPLTIAIANLDEDMVEFLLENGVKINVKGCFGMTPLSMAVKMNAPVTVKFLLSQGAKPTLKDIDGLDSLHYARMYGCQDIIDLLDTNKEHRVDYYKKNKNILLGNNMLKKILYFLFVDDALKKDIMFLKKIPLFVGLSGKSLAKIALLVFKKTYIQDEKIYEKNKEANVLYIIKNGQVRLTEKNLSKVLETGDFFGEISLIENCTHKYDASALKDSELYLVYRAKIADLFESDNKIGLTVMKNLATILAKKI
ncbi:MAG: ankyrin repeat domain-containing protein [Endomicrobium sp.]|jgi:ankyrin repeat protein|nr:ankyrin repeat domain-containing protein [Endomicrobium sp.]